MRSGLMSAVFCVGFAFGIGTGEAHHSFSAQFDAKSPVTFTATVVKLEWVNPHVWIHVDVKKPDGTLERTRVLTGPPNALIRRGMTKNSLPAGTVVVIDGFKAFDGTPTVSADNLTFPNGQKLFLGSGATP